MPLLSMTRDSTENMTKTGQRAILQPKGVVWALLKTLGCIGGGGGKEGLTDLLTDPEK